MSASDKVSVADFFDGVAEMREYLDRHKMQRGRDQLTRMAIELSKSRSAEALGAWLCGGMAQAVNARGAAILLREGAGHAISAHHGEVSRLPASAELSAATAASAKEHTLVAKRAGSVAALVGTNGAYGALWIEHDQPVESGLIPL